MKKILVTMLLALGALSFNGAPLFAASSDPSAIQQSKKKKTETVTFKVGMHCKNCVKKVTDNISFEKGVKDLKVSLEDKTVTITYDPAKTNPETLKKAIEKLGYKVE